jgi:hypothetical protein
MNGRSRSVAAIGAAFAAAALVFLTQQARSQMINASPSLIPIGVSSSGSTSTAWFHEPHSRLAVACQTVAGQGQSLSSVLCVTTKLP